ncbi:MAG TPA: hypothetical protein VNL71_15650 [Chloroflexota bacterium]|nr:hypothetical protein [Chloroflexota bacterium]
MQRIWRFVLGIYLGPQPDVEVADLCRMLDLPDPEQDHGEALLVAAARWLDPTETTDWAGSWEDAAAQLLSDLRFEPAQSPVERDHSSGTVGRTMARITPSP